MANRKSIQVWCFAPTQRKIQHDPSGRSFGRLYCIGLAGVFRSSTYWLCECDCGEFVFISTTQLIRTDKKATRSCGCLHKGVNKKHGYSHSNGAYKSWCGMRDRCLNPRNQDYADYGGRGVNVCARWLESFENFLEDMGQPPSPRHSIDRFPDKNGNYEPENARWATPKEQARNTRNNKLVTFNNQTFCLAEWAEKIGVDQDTLSWRLLNGWTIEQALTIPTGGKR